MLRWCSAAAIVVVATAGSFPTLARGQEQTNPEEITRKYEDALSQLKASQDRKNELATENEQLKSRLAELEARLAERDREAADYARETFVLRAHYASWQRFIDRYPHMAARWRMFMENALMSPAPAPLPEMIEPSGTMFSTSWPDSLETE